MTFILSPQFKHFYDNHQAANKILKCLLKLKPNDVIKLMFHEMKLIDSIRQKIDYSAEYIIKWQKLIYFEAIVNKIMIDKQALLIRAMINNKITSRLPFVGFFQTGLLFNSQTEYIINLLDNTYIPVQIVKNNATY